MLRKYAEIFAESSAKATHIFSAKNIRILCIKSAKTVNEMTLNKLFKLMMLCLLFFIVLGFNDTSPLRVILCRLPEKGRKEIEERVEEMKERDREERGTGMKVKKQEK